MVLVLTTLGVVAACVPGAGRVAKAAIVGYPFLMFTELKMNARWIFLGLPTNQEERHKVFAEIREFTLESEQLPVKLRKLAGTYLLTKKEFLLIVMAIRSMDIAFQLEGPDWQLFEAATEDGPLREELRSQFQAHGVDVEKLLELGQRRQKDIFMRTAMASMEKAAA